MKLLNLDEEHEVTISGTKVSIKSMTFADRALLIEAMNAVDKAKKAGDESGAEFIKALQVQKPTIDSLLTKYVTKVDLEGIASPSEIWDRIDFGDYMEIVSSLFKVSGLKGEEKGN